MTWRELPERWQREARRWAQDYLNASYAEMHSNGEMDKAIRLRINSRDITEYLDDSEKDWRVVRNRDGIEHLEHDIPDDY